MTRAVGPNPPRQHERCRFRNHVSTSARSLDLRCPGLSQPAVRLPDREFDFRGGDRFFARATTYDADFHAAGDRAVSLWRVDDAANGDRAGPVFGPDSLMGMASPRHRNRRPLEAAKTLRRSLPLSR